MNPPPLLSFSREARALFDDQRRELEPRLGPLAELGHVADWANRHPGRLARMAALLHLAGGQGPQDLIAGETMSRACLIGDFLLEQGLRALEQPDATMRRALVVLEHWDLATTITVRDLHRHVLHGRGDANTAHQLARKLVDSGHLSPSLALEDGPGRPSPAFDITPAGLEAFHAA